MKLFFKVCMIFFVAACFSACEVQGTVDDIVDGTPTKSDTVLPAKFVKYQKADSVKETEEHLPQVFRR